MRLGTPHRRSAVGRERRPRSFFRLGSYSSARGSAFSPSADRFRPCSSRTPRPASGSDSTGRRSGPGSPG
eukprot:1821429-Alexandrium_andersonii.AAC.1